MIWTVIERAASVIALLGVPYLVYDRYRHLPRIAFDNRGGGRSRGLSPQVRDQGEIRFDGFIRNRSLEPNTLEHVALIMWRHWWWHGKLARFSSNDVEVRLRSGELLSLPHRLEPREFLYVQVRCPLDLSKEPDRSLFEKSGPRDRGNRRVWPRRQYELGFYDVSQRFYDQKGHLQHPNGFALWRLIKYRKAAIRDQQGVVNVLRLVPSRIKHDVTLILGKLGRLIGL